MVEALSSLENYLAEAVKSRIETIPEPSTDSVARLAILFSGGLDCICLAALADRFLPPGEPCDLLNVAFENPRIEKNRSNIAIQPKGKKKTRSKSTPTTPEESTPPAMPTQPKRSTYDVPDRLTGRMGVAELKELFPERPWRFVEVDIPYKEALEARGRVLELIKPLETVMDWSIAIAFWFAARGIGHVKYETGQSIPYSSQVKVLFSGLGADEQLGGYGRHRVRYNQNGWAGLIEEVQLDVDRISWRNMGRDDRIVSDHGREVRFPFLSEALVSALNEMPIHLKVDPRYGRGIGEKLLLRQLAHKIGLGRASKEPKRAVQFGARTAKMESGSQTGTETVRKGSTEKRSDE
ncbi:Asparagine synthetase domain-containing protein 1 [Rhizophlyctis rosea]|uniref:Asparagine synthetase domain-containing protein 1 n=1 Tax=Rhizophlyctis rosea TaxID=64517 RepID=A0AAD5SKS6_9FUNG|nr:Asparagine synthetase domain-containing protein 1 [Rhizophlyctis rosea]